MSSGNFSAHGSLRDLMGFRTAHAQRSILPKHLNRLLCGFACFLSSCPAQFPFPPGSCPTNFHSPQHSQTPIPVSSVQGEHRSLPGSPLLDCSLENASRQMPTVITNVVLLGSFLSSITDPTLHVYKLWFQTLSSFLVVYG